MTPKTVYKFGKKGSNYSKVLFKSNGGVGLSLKTADEFNKMAIKFSGFVESLDTTKALSRR